ncbi:unnamed protein product, partial [Closterium sp. NIES-64]
SIPPVLGRLTNLTLLSFDQSGLSCPTAGTTDCAVNHTASTGTEMGPGVGADSSKAGVCPTDAGVVSAVKVTFESTQKSPLRVSPASPFSHTLVSFHQVNAMAPKHHVRLLGFCVDMNPAAPHCTPIPLPPSPTPGECDGIEGWHLRSQLLHLSHSSTPLLSHLIISSHQVNAMASKHHPNLVRLLGFCIDFNADTEEMEQVVVYEFMENGDLDRWIGDEAPKALSLLERVNIFIEAPKPLSLLERVDILIVVMLAVITAQHAVRTQQDTSRVNLKAWVAPLVSAHDVASFKDPRLEGPADVILRLAELALSCTAMPTASRPDMMRIIGGLKAMRAELTGGDVDERAIRIDSELAIGVGETLEEQIMRVESMGDVPVLLDCQALWIRNFTGWTTGEDCATAEGLQCDSQRKYRRWQPLRSPRDNLGHGDIVPGSRAEKSSMEMSSLAGVLPSSIGNPTHPMHLTDQRPFRCSPPSPTTHAPFSSPQVNGDVVSCRGAAVVHQQPDAPHASDRPAPFSLLSPLSNHTRSLLFPSGQWRCRLLQGSMEMSSLAGVLPSSIGNLTLLTHLLAGELPSSIGNLTLLTHLLRSSPHPSPFFSPPPSSYPFPHPPPVTTPHPFDSKHTSYPFPHPPPVTTPHPSPLRCPTFFFPFLSSFPSLHPFLPLYPSLASPLLSLTPPLPHPSSPSPLLSFTPPLPHPSSPSPLLSLTPPLPHPSSPSPLLSFTPPLPHSSSPSPLLSLTPPLPHPSPPLNHSSSRPSPYRNFFRNNLNSGITTTFGALTIPPPCMLLPIRSSHCLALSSPPVLITPPSNLFQTNLFDSDVPTTIGASTSPTTLSLISSPNPNFFQNNLDSDVPTTFGALTIPPSLALSQSHHLAFPCLSALSQARPSPPPFAPLLLSPLPLLPATSFRTISTVTSPPPVLPALPSPPIPSSPLYLSPFALLNPSALTSSSLSSQQLLSEQPRQRHPHHLWRSHQPAAPVSMPCAALCCVYPILCALPASSLPPHPSSRLEVLSLHFAPSIRFPFTPSPPPTHHSNLGINMLTGPLPLFLDTLSLLTFLNLGDNKLTGTLSAGLGNLKQLQFLDLSKNNRSVQEQRICVPAINTGITLNPHMAVRCSLSLTWLYVAHSPSHGCTLLTLPHMAVRCSLSLTWLYVAHSPSHGCTLLTLPHMAVRCSLSLTWLYVAHSPSHGCTLLTLPHMAVRCSLSLTWLYVAHSPSHDCTLLTLPHMAVRCSLSLTWLYVAHSPSHGCTLLTLPHMAVRCSLSLTWLYVAHSPSHGCTLLTLPHMAVRCSLSLTWLYVAHSPSHGCTLLTLPHMAVRCSLSLTWLYVAHSPLTWLYVAHSPSHGSTLQSTSSTAVPIFSNLASNKLNGSVPVFDGFPALTYLGLGGNSLQGTFPVTGNQALPLTEWNSLQGTFPVTGNQALPLTESAWEGTAFKAPSPSRATRLFPSRHYLRGNIFKLAGSICDPAMPSPFLHASDLRGNKLAGSIPRSISSLSALEHLRMLDGDGGCGRVTSSRVSSSLVGIPLSTSSNCGINFREDETLGPSLSSFCLPDAILSSLSLAHPLADSLPILLSSLQAYSSHPSLPLPCSLVSENRFKDSPPDSITSLVSPSPPLPLDHSPPPPSTTPHHPPRPLPTTPLDHSPPPPSTTPHRPPRPLPTTPLLAPLSRFLCRLLSENRFNGFLPYSL